MATGHYADKRLRNSRYPSENQTPEYEWRYHSHVCVDPPTFADLILSIRIVGYHDTYTDLTNEVDNVEPASVQSYSPENVKRNMARIHNTSSKLSRKEAMAEHHKQLYHYRKSIGVCAECGNRPPYKTKHGKVLARCEECRAQANRNAHIRYYSRKEQS